MGPRAAIVIWMSSDWMPVWLGLPANLMAACTAALAASFRAVWSDFHRRWLALGLALVLGKALCSETNFSTLWAQLCLIIACM